MSKYNATVMVVAIRYTEPFLSISIHNEDGANCGGFFVSSKNGKTYASSDFAEECWCSDPISIGDDMICEDPYYPNWDKIVAIPEVAEAIAEANRHPAPDWRIDEHETPIKHAWWEYDPGLGCATGELIGSGKTWKWNALDCGEILYSGETDDRNHAMALVEMWCGRIGSVIYDAVWVSEGDTRVLKGPEAGILAYAREITESDPETGFPVVIGDEWWTAARPDIRNRANTVEGKSARNEARRAVIAAATEK